MKHSDVMQRSLIVASLVLAAAACTGLGAMAGHGKAKPIPGVRSPSGNIRCLFVPAARGPYPPNLLCTIAQASYTGALQNHCIDGPGLDWHGFELTTTRKGAVLCTGGILYDEATQTPTFRTLAYGTTWAHGPFTCRSRREGLTCVSAAGHGLFLSRESWRAW